MKMKRNVLLLTTLVFILIFFPYQTIKASSKISLSETTLYLPVGESEQLYDYNTTKTVSWSSGNKNTATVKDGLVKGLKAGTTTITAKSGKSTAKCKVIVYVPATSAEFSMSKLWLSKGDTFTITPKFYPNNATFKTLTWEVVDYDEQTNVIKHIKQNTFKANKNGYSQLVATQKESNQTYRILIYVGPEMQEHTMIGKEIIIAKDKTLQLEPLLRDIDGDLIRKATSTNLISIRDPKIATLSKELILTGKSIGTTTLTLYTNYGIQKTFSIKVVDSPYLTLSSSYIEKHNTTILDTFYRYHGTDSTEDLIYAFELSDGNLGVFTHMEKMNYDINEVISQALNIKIYTPELKYLSEKTIALPYQLFGGVFQGNNGEFYVAVGQHNEEENNNKVVASIIRYNSSFIETGRCNITGADSFSSEPFSGGASDIAIDGNTLIFHSGRQMYKIEDNIIHQSNVTYRINLDSMSLEYQNNFVTHNYVSHSLNQYVNVENGNILYIDQGDAYPRALSLKIEHDYKSNPLGQHMTDLNVIEFKGDIGDNDTQCQVSGFELGKFNNILAGVAGDHSAMPNNQMTSTNHFNVYISLLSKDGTSSELKWLTNYGLNDDYKVRTLRMVKLPNDKFALLYTLSLERKYQDDLKTGLFIVDSTGKIYENKIYENFISGNTQPIYYNGSLLWIDSHNEDNILGESIKPLNAFYQIYLGY